MATRVGWWGPIHRTMIRVVITRIVVLFACWCSGRVLGGASSSFSNGILQKRDREEYVIKGFKLLNKSQEEHPHKSFWRIAKHLVLTKTFTSKISTINQLVSRVTHRSIYEYTKTYYHNVQIERKIEQNIQNATIANKYI